MTEVFHVRDDTDRRVCICGSRDWFDPAPINAVLDAYDPAYTTIVHGGAPGADSLAGQLAILRGFAVDVFLADWDRLDKAAGHVRNQEMVDSGLHVVHAFPLPSSRGTWDMVRRSRNAGVLVTVWGEDG